MSWVNWKRKANLPATGVTGVLGLDLNASRVRVMCCAQGRPPRTVALDEPHEELPLAVSLEKSAPAIGRPALTLARKLPHQVCFDFLNDLGTTREFRHGRHVFNAAGLLDLAIGKVQSVCPVPEHLTLTLPSYLTTPQVAILNSLLEKAKLPWRGSAALPVALLAATDPAERRPPLALIIDVDDHALSAALVSSNADQVRMLGTAIQPKLNLRIWKDRLLNALSDRCVRVCRRDPRDSAVAEQALYDQLDDALDRLLQSQNVEFTIRSEHWYQQLPQQPEDFISYCSGLVKQTVALARELVQGLLPEPPHAVWLTYAAGRLPGLALGLHQHMAERTGAAMLPADAGARAAILLAPRWLREELPRTHLDASILLPEPPRDPRSVNREVSIPTPRRTSRFDH
ncbi:MAG TPA: hypothetical protein VKS79_19435 [Gemmataceae bacterium]|nr:hypothetical protein [Gemmataceae bacterium]